MSNDQAIAPGAASQAMLQAEAKDYQRKVMQSLLEAAAITDPSLTQRVTVAAIWQYFRLPDESFGWSGKKADDGTRPPMPAESKALCILTTLSLSLMPGVGHVLWLGNKAYVTADARRFLANKSPDVVYKGQRTLRPFTPDEKEMFGVEDGDMHCVVEQPVTFKGSDAVWVGYGLIGKHELDWRDKYGNMKAGMQSKKDCAMHLITRAERDMLNRNFPVSGLADAPDNPSEYADDRRTVTVSTQSPAELAASEPAPAVPRDEALVRFKDLCSRVLKAGGDATNLLNRDAGTLVVNGTADALFDAGDVLEAWLAEHEQPDPTPPTAPSGEPAKKRGRPRKSEAPAAAPLIPSDPVTSTALGRSPFAAPTEADYEEAPPPPEEAAAPAVETYNGTDAHKARIRVAAAAAGITAEGDLWAIAGAMKSRAMSELESCVAALKSSRVKATAATTATAATPALSPQAVRANAVARFRAALKRVEELGGAPMHVLGLNPHNAIERGETDELEALSSQLEQWSPPAAAPKPAPAPAAAAMSPPAAAPRPTATTAPAKRTPALDMIDRVLAGGGPSEVPETVKVRLRDLRERELKDGDHLHLPKAIREAKGGNFRELDELIKGRPVRS